MVSFTLAQRRAHYRAHPEKRNALQARWRARHPGAAAANQRAYRNRQARKAEIAGALASLLSAHRLRLIGVRLVRSGQRDGFDSWAMK